MLSLAAAADMRARILASLCAPALTVHPRFGVFRCAAADQM